MVPARILLQSFPDSTPFRKWENPARIGTLDTSPGFLRAVAESQPRSRQVFDRVSLHQLFERKVPKAMERTLVLLKPDCVQRRMVGRIISRFEEKSLDIVAMKLMHVTPELSKKHYAEHVSKPFYPGLEAFITGAPVVAMIVQGLEAIRVVRDMLGATSGLKAAPGTIRGDYSGSRQMNLVHASDGPDAAAREIGLYFKPEEICKVNSCMAPWLRAADE